MKLVIGGGARCGKTTYAAALSRQYELPVYHSDDLIDLGWSEASDAFADVIAYGRDGIFEGVAAVRALRKLVLCSRARPCTRYLHLWHPFEALSVGQRSMNAGVETVFVAIHPRLRSRGVDVWRMLPPRLARFSL